MDMHFITNTQYFLFTHTWQLRYTARTDQRL